MAPLLFVRRHQREKQGGVYTFETGRVFYTPICRTAGWLVFLGNRSYAGFDTEQEAREATELWKSLWPAGQGKIFTVLPRLS